MAAERLSRLQRRILAWLAQEEQRTRGTMAASHQDLVHAMAADKGNLSRSLGNLEAKGLITITRTVGGKLLIRKESYSLPGLRPGAADEPAGPHGGGPGADRRRCCSRARQAMLGHNPCRPGQTWAQTGGVAEADAGPRRLQRLSRILREFSGVAPSRAEGNPPAF